MYVRQPLATPRLATGRTMLVSQWRPETGWSALLAWCLLFARSGIAQAVRRTARYR